MSKDDAPKAEAPKPSTKEPAEDPNAGRAVTWMDVGHIAGDLPEGVTPHAGKVAVYADNGEVVDPQPEVDTPDE